MEINNELEKLIKEYLAKPIKTKCTCGCNKCVIKSDNKSVDNFINEHKQLVLENETALINKDNSEVLDSNIDIVKNYFNWRKSQKGDNDGWKKLADYIDSLKTKETLTPEDIEFIKRYTKKAGKDFSKIDENQEELTIRNEREGDSLFCFIDVNGKEIGKIVLETEDGKTWTIIDANIEDNFQGKGYYQKALIELINSTPGMTIVSIFRSDSAERAWNSLIKKLPSNIKSKIIDHPEEETKEIIISNGEIPKHDLDESKKSKTIGAGILCLAEDTKKFLVVKRSANCDSPNTWCGAGGKVEPEDEDLKATALREFKEECGFDLSNAKIKKVHTHNSPELEFHNYIAVTPEEFEPVLDTTENVDYKWLTKQELIDLENKHFGLEEVLNKIFKKENVNEIKKGDLVKFPYVTKNNIVSGEFVRYEEGDSTKPYGIAVVKYKGKEIKIKDSLLKEIVNEVVQNPTKEDYVKLWQELFTAMLYFNHALKKGEFGYDYDFIKSKYDKVKSKMESLKPFEDTSLSDLDENKKNLKEEYFNPIDIVTLDVPLLIRLLEYAREDAKDDMDLHKLAEKLIGLSSTGGILSMEDYDSLITKEEKYTD